MGTLKGGLGVPADYRHPARRSNPPNCFCGKRSNPLSAARARFVQTTRGAVSEAPLIPLVSIECTTQASQRTRNNRLTIYGISVRLHFGISDGRGTMKENIVVSGRGQITLPASMRKRLGIKAGGVLVVEDRKGELVLRPAAIVELDTYTEEEIARWEREDRLAPGERSRILKKLGRKR